MTNQTLLTLASILGAVLLMGSFALYAVRRTFGRPELVFSAIGALLIIIPVATRVGIKHGDTEIIIEGIKTQVAAIQTDVKQVAQVQHELVDVQQEALRAVVANEQPPLTTTTPATTTAPATTTTPPTTTDPVPTTAEPSVGDVLSKLDRLDRRTTAINHQINSRALRVQ